MWLGWGIRATGWGGICGILAAMNVVKRSRSCTASNCSSHVSSSVQRSGSLLCPHPAFLSSLSLSLFLEDTLKNDNWLLYPEAVQPEGSSA